MKNDNERGENKLRGLPGDLYMALAATFGFYFKAHVAHWNVTGPNFSSLHALFGDIYEDAHEAVDALAERMRTLDVKVPCDLDDLDESSGIDAFSGSEDSAALIKGLLAANETVIGALAIAVGAADHAKEIGISNFLQERIDKHAKWHWMLNATSGAP